MNKETNLKIATSEIRAYIQLTSYVQTLREIASYHHGNNGGLNPYPISGGTCEHWPRETRDAVITAKRTAEKHLEQSLVAWKASGKHKTTWVRMKDSLINA
jgi:hypothetical protein